MRVLVVDSHGSNSELYHQISLHYTTDVVGEGGEAIEYLRNKSVDAVIIKYLLTDMKGTQVASLIKKLHPSVIVFIASSDSSMEKWKETTAAKAKFLPMPIDIQKFEMLIKSSTESDIPNETEQTSEKTSVSNVDTDFSHNTVPESIKVPIFDRVPDHKQVTVAKPKNRRQIDYPHCKVVSIFSPKGGVGKTTTAVNLATLLKTELGLRTVILEFTRQTGNVLGHFSLNPSIDISDWITRKELPSIDEVDDLLLWCPNTEIAILPTQRLIDEDANKVKILPEHVVAIIETLNQLFDVIIIDGGTIIDEVLFQIAEVSDHIIMVSKMERETLQDCHYMPLIFERRGIDTSKLIHVVNQAKKGVGITEKDALAAVGVELRHVVHFDPEVEKIPKEKDPYLVRNKKQGKYFQEIWNLASMVVEHPDFDDQKENFVKKLMFWK